MRTPMVWGSPLVWSTAHFGREEHVQPHVGNLGHLRAVMIPVFERHCHQHPSAIQCSRPAVWLAGVNFSKLVVTPRILIILSLTRISNEFRIASSGSPWIRWTNSRRFRASVVAHFSCFLSTPCGQTLKEVQKSWSPESLETKLNLLG